jgi:hypothetical protein
MPLRHTGIRLEDQTVPATPLAVRRPITSIRVADRVRYCRQFIGRHVTVTVRLDRSRYRQAEGILHDVVSDVGRGQVMLLLGTGGEQPWKAVYVGHLAAFHPQPESGG